MNEPSNRVCPVEKAGGLNMSIRRWLQNPQRILRPYIREGMTVLDVGCGPGFFSVDMAEMVGEKGHVIAADLQEGMLEKVREKIIGTTLEQRITLHKAEADSMQLATQVDFILLFYMVHEVPDKHTFLAEVKSVLKPGGQVLIVEPPMHVSKAAFTEMIGIAREIGFTDAAGPKVLLSKSVVLKNA